MFRENGTYLTNTGVAIKVGELACSTFLWLRTKTAKPTSSRLEIDKRISVCFFRCFIGASLASLYQILTTTYSQDTFCSVKMSLKPNECLGVAVRKEKSCKQVAAVRV